MKIDPKKYSLILLKFFDIFTRFLTPYKFWWPISQWNCLGRAGNAAGCFAYILWQIHAHTHWAVFIPYIYTQFWVFFLLDYIFLFSSSLLEFIIILRRSIKLDINSYHFSVYRRKIEWLTHAHPGFTLVWTYLWFPLIKNYSIWKRNSQENEVWNAHSKYVRSRHVIIYTRMCLRVLF